MSNNSTARFFLSANWACYDRYTMVMRHIMFCKGLYIRIMQKAATTTAFSLAKQVDKHRRMGWGKYLEVWISVLT